MAIRLRESLLSVLRLNLGPKAALSAALLIAINTALLVGAGYWSLTRDFDTRAERDIDLNLRTMSLAFAEAFPDAKVIACVRQLSWVLDSMERLVRRQPVGVSKVFRFDTNTTVYSRVEALTDPRGMVGFSFQATKDAFYGQYAPGHLLLLTYESLARNPSAAMRAVYQFIGEPWFEHDFDHLSYKADEVDARVGMPGLHSVRPKVEPIERTPILPREIFGRFVNESFWMDPKNNVSQVPVV